MSLTVRVHPRSKGVEDASDADVDVVLPVKIEKKGLCHALTFVVARSYTCKGPPWNRLFLQAV